MKKGKRLAWVSGVMAALTLALGASTAGAYNRYSEPGANCQPYWRDSETHLLRSTTGKQTNGASESRLMVCPVRLDSDNNDDNRVYATVYASTGVGCYLTKNIRGSWDTSPVAYSNGMYLNTQLTGTFTLHAWQLVCSVPRGGYINSYRITTYE